MMEKRETRSGDVGDPFAATQFVEPDASLSRQEEDIALAAELLKSGYVNDRQIAAAISDWSVHGSIPLAQHLESKQLLTDDQLKKLSAAAHVQVEKLRHSIAEGSEAPAAGSGMLLATLERLDGSGRVAKLLGVTVAASDAGDDNRVMEGRFELIRKIGQGGLGRVWLARDVNLNRHVALKEISHGSASKAVIERFKREAEITGRLDHPSIVPIHQLGKDAASGRMFYTMRFLGRSTLQDSINEYHERRQADDDDPMLLRMLLTAFVNVCHAMGHAHSRQVIHRDLKPENVVIDSFGQVIVIDWGLAKVVDETSVESMMESSVSEGGDQTLDGQVLGTPLYMAPEQAAGRLDELDQRTDIFGLGAMLFSVITGCAPHERTQREAVDSGAGKRGMISVIAAGTIPSAQEINPKADPALQAICQKAMSRRRYGRYQQATEVAEDVQRWMAGEPVTARKETPRQRVNRWLTQHRAVSQSLIAAAMVALVALTTLGMSARHQAEVATRTRFNEMLGDAVEVEAQFRNIAVDLSKDVRFLASLPPIQGIIRAQQGVEGDSLDVWQERLGSIYESMLRSETDYLALAFEAKQGERTVDLVRVERNAFEPTLLRVLPASAGQTFEADELLKGLELLEPGDVNLCDSPRTRHLEKPYSIDRLSVATPVFSDIDGHWFGMTVIETDITKRVTRVMGNRIAPNHEIYVGDGSGQLWVTSDPEHGVQIASRGSRIPDLPDSVMERMSTEGLSFEMQEENAFYAKRFYAAPTGRGVLIYARLLGSS
ncbi:MAG: serine/threonine-protein kinase [Planctomycetota bacterium]